MIRLRVTPASALEPLAPETKSGFLVLTLATPIAEISPTTVPPKDLIAARASAADTPWRYWTTYSRTFPSPAALAGTAARSPPATTATTAAMTMRLRMGTTFLRGGRYPTSGRSNAQSQGLLGLTCNGRQGRTPRHRRAATSHGAGRGPALSRLPGHSARPTGQNAIPLAAYGDTTAARAGDQDGGRQRSAGPGQLAGPGGGAGADSGRHCR